MEAGKRAIANREANRVACRRRGTSQFGRRQGMQPGTALRRTCSMALPVLGLIGVSPGDECSVAEDETMDDGGCVALESKGVHQ